MLIANCYYKCQEASIYSYAFYVPCGNEAVAIVYQAKDRRAYYMCEACTYHNINNRGGKLVARKEKERSV